jgi:DNA-binding transcriptional ArsR family regulator
LARQKQATLIDQRLLKALAHPTRQFILHVLSEGPSSPIRIKRRMQNVSLNLVSHHIKVLRELGCVELIDTVQRRGATEHIYRATSRSMFTVEEWEQLGPKDRYPITADILRMVSEDTSRSLTEGGFDERTDNHVSRSPIELDEEGWSEVVQTLGRALDEVLEAHGRSAERARVSSEKLINARVVIMQFLIGRENPPETEDA